VGGKMFMFILADAHLELIPKKLWRHPSIRKWSKIRKKKPSQLILDQTLYYSAIRGDAELRKRGRVDILHRALLTILDSKLCMDGKIIGILIHTINNEVYFVDPKTRLPRHYFRFLGLMEKLLVEKSICADEETLIRKCSSLTEELEKNNIGYVVGLSRRGREENLQDYIQRTLQRHSKIAFVVGAFPEGYFSEEIQRHIDDIISLGKESYTTSYVLCKIINHCEQITLRGV